MAVSGRPISLLLLLLLAVAGTGCGSGEGRKARYLEQGQAHFAAGDYVKAALDFRNALQIDPEDSTAHLALARSLNAQGSPREAARHYLAVLRDLPEHVEASVELGYLLLRAGSPEDARGYAERVLAVQPDHADALTLRAASSFANGNPEPARADIAHALRVAPDHKNAIGLSARLLVTEGKVAAAIDLIQAWLARHPEDVELHRVLADIHTEAGDGPRAIETLRRIVTLAPNEPAHRIALARRLLASGDDLGAEQVLREALRASGTTSLRLELIHLVTRNRGVEAGLATIRELLAAAPEDPDLRFALAVAHETAGDFESARKELEGLLPRDGGAGPIALGARARLAGLAWRSGNAEQAQAWLGEVLAASPRDRPALLLRGQMALARGDALAAIADFRSVRRDYPDDPELPKLLARAHAANGEPELTLEQLRRAIELQPDDTAARLALAGLYRDQGDAEGAEQVLRERLEAVPDDAAAAEALLNQYLQSGQASQAQDLATRIKTARPDGVLGHHLAGVAWQAAGDHERAATEFEAVIARQPKAIDALSRLVALRLLQKQPERARQTLDGLLAQDGAHVVARNLIGELDLAEGRAAAAATEFAAAIALRPDWDVPHRNLALARAAAGDVAGARQALAAGIAACGESLPLLLERARLARGSGAYDEAIDVYSRLLERFPDATAFANDLAMLLADHAAGDPAKLARAKELAARLPTAEPNHLDTQGWVEYRLGNLDRALELLHRAASGAPDLVAIRYHLGMVYAARGDRANALRQLRDAVDSGARFEDAAAAATALAALESGP